MQAEPGVGRLSCVLGHVLPAHTSAHVRPCKAYCTVKGMPEEERDSEQSGLTQFGAVPLDPRAQRGTIPVAVPGGQVTKQRASPGRHGSSIP